MSGSKKKPSPWYYVLALLLPVFACGLTGFLVYRNVPELPGALEAFDVNNLTWVIMPGSAEINFPKSGAYAVYYEYRSTIDGVRYVRATKPPSINCQLSSKTSGEEIVLATPHVEGDIYSTNNQEHVGVLMKSISINQPGVYVFSCRYLDESPNPQIVLAVGPNMIWEFFNLAVKPFAAVVSGFIVFFGMCVISLIIVVIVAIKRNQFNNRVDP
jgi:hypothetical protein